MSVFKPRLRAEVSLQLHEESGTFALGDTLYGRRVAVDKLAAAIVAHCDGERPLATVVDAFIAPERPRVMVEAVVRSLLFLDVFEASGSEAVRRARALRDEPEGSTDTLVLPDLRFACEGSGDCCRTYTLGPLTDEDCARLDALDLSAFAALEGGRAYEERPLPGGARTGRMIRSAPTGGCVFLQEDHRCGIHARFGEEAKPHLCRIYPFDITARVDGVRIYDRGGCSRFATTSQRGDAVAREEHRLVQLRARPARLEHPIVRWSEGVSTDYAVLMPWVDAAVAAVRRDVAPWVALRVVTRRALTIADELPACALTPRGAFAVVAEVLARPEREFSRPVSDAARHAGVEALVRVCDELTAAAEGVLAAPAGATPAYIAPGIETLLTLLRVTREHGLARQHPDARMTETRRAALAVTIDHEAVWAPLRSSLRGFLFGRGALVSDDLRAGLLQACFVQTLALVGARWQAGRDGASAASPEHLNLGHKSAQTVLSLPALRRVLVSRAGLVGPCVDALTVIARHG